MTADLSFLIGVARGELPCLRCMWHMFAFGLVDLIMFGLHSLDATILASMAALVTTTLPAQRRGM